MTLRILTIGHSYVIGMNRAVIREVARDPAFDVTLAAPNFFHGDLRPVSLEPEPDHSPLRIVGLDTFWSRFVHIFRYQGRALNRLVRAGGFDVVHAWEEPYIFSGYQIARAVAPTSSRFCFRTAQNYRKRYPPPFQLFERHTLARAQGWIASGSLVDQAMRERGYPVERGRLIPLGVDLQAFQPLDPSLRARMLRSLGLSPPVLGFLGRLTPAKGLDVLMQALDLLPPSRPWSLLVLGSGPEEARVRRWAAQRGWSSRVRIKLVQHQEVPRFLGTMDLLLAPSQTVRNWREQFGRMLIEAFASGVPVIGSDSGEIPYVVGDAGRIVPEADAAAWARAIEEWLDDPATRKDMARRGLDRVQRFSVPAVAQQYRDYFRWLVEQPWSKSA
ncbi:MAG: glycosyltransferase family 4 protein [Planctomycetes bacterium]|nr:glycosyltransferase family 4 protein [Planctomycetota bacterium]